MSGYLPVTEEATTIAGAEAVEEFVEGILLDPARTMPVVVFSPTSEGEYVPGIERVTSLAHGTLGAARVFRLATPGDTFSLTDRVGRPLSVWNGALRIYWPGFTLASSPFDITSSSATGLRPGSSSGSVAT